MSKTIYSFKYGSSVKLTSQREKGLCSICIFIVRVYVKAWFTAPFHVSCPMNVRNPNILKTDKKLMLLKVDITKFIRQLCYLCKENSLRRYNSLSPKKGQEDIKGWGFLKLEDCLSKHNSFLEDSWNLYWSSQGSLVMGPLRSLQCRLKNCSTAAGYNDCLERRIPLIEQYNTIITNNQTQKQYLLLLIQDY